MKNRMPTILAFVAVSVFAACGGDSPQNSNNSGSGEAAHQHEAGHDHRGSHGGQLIELGSAAHLEFVRTAATGKVTLFITRPDGKTPLPIATAPEIKLVTDAGPQKLPTTAVNSVDGVASEFSTTHDALKAHQLAGRVSVVVGGKLFNPELAEDHGHQHD